MRFLFVALLILAQITMYGKTGNKMANGEYPYVGSVACPRSIVLGTRVRILGIVFTCGDRTAFKYNGRFDLYSLGTKTQMLEWGNKTLDVEVL